ncbi:MAG: winged helix-turn-helix domain-containing protein [Myxococcota bacterium]
MTAPSSWTFLSNYAHVLVVIARNPDVRVRDIADSVGITERAVQRILGELEGAGVLSRSREGRRTLYAIDRTTALRHPLECHHSVAELLDLLCDDVGELNEPSKVTKSTELADPTELAS